MVKMICLSVVTGVIALSAAVPVVVRTGSGTLAESGAMLLTATAFFGLAAVMRRSKGSPRR
jgi:hypothetical protein